MECSRQGKITIAIYYRLILFFDKSYVRIINKKGSTSRSTKADHKASEIVKTIYVDMMRACRAWTFGTWSPPKKSTDYVGPFHKTTKTWLWNINGCSKTDHRGSKPCSTTHLKERFTQKWKLFHLLTFMLLQTCINIFVLLNAKQKHHLLPIVVKSTTMEVSGAQKETLLKRNE